VRPLLFAARQAADALGICFHVGSQAMSPAAYSEAMQRVRAAIVEAAVTVDIVDVGGGFPSVYPGMEPPPLDAYFDVIHDAFESLPISYSAELWCEPGRALCAEYASVLVRVEKRRGDQLYINDGAYGALFDAAHIGCAFPVKLLREGGSKARADGVQLLRGRPATTSTIWPAAVHAARPDVDAGDYVEIRHARSLMAARWRTGFNGFGSDLKIVVEDEADGDALWRRRGTPRGAERRPSCSRTTLSGVIPAQAENLVSFCGRREIPAFRWNGVPLGNLESAMNDVPVNDTRKADCLAQPVEHIDIKSFDARPIVDAMKKMSFTSRDLGRATEIYNQMLADPDCSIILVIAGSTSAGGCMDVYADLVKHNMVDAVVATGATIVDMDFFEALGHKHYQALEIPDDDLCARSTSTGSTTPISTRRSFRRRITRSPRSRIRSSPGPIRRAPSSARWANG
jgi:hypothetical protein